MAFTDPWYGESYLAERLADRLAGPSGTWRERLAAWAVGVLSAAVLLPLLLYLLNLTWR